MKYLSVVFALVSFLHTAPAFSQTQWTKRPTPVLDVGPAGSWDDQWAIASRVIRVGDTLKMWYSGRKSSFGVISIGYAWSTDGGLSWTKYPSPVMTPTQTWEAQSVWQPYVILFSSVDSPYVYSYKMWYGGGSGGGIGGIGYAWSANGIQWTKYTGNPVVRPGPFPWDAENVEGPCVLLYFYGVNIEAGFQMWYEGVPFGLDTLRVGYATTTNETTWTNANSINPVLSPQPGTWEPTWLRSPRVLSEGGKYKMWYSAGPPYNTNNRGIGYATSLDGVNWTRSSANPVLQSTPGTWDAGGIWPGDVLSDGTTYHMWYQAGFLTALRTGYATAPVTAVREVPGDLPGAFALEQNYPNPFNPSTNFGFKLQASGFTSLRVYNMLGQEVATLVNEELKPGRYEVSWEAAGLASGVYFYRLTAAPFTQTKKLVLMR